MSLGKGEWRRPEHVFTPTATATGHDFDAENALTRGGNPMLSQWVVWRAPTEYFTSRRGPCRQGLTVVHKQNLSVDRIQAPLLPRRWLYATNRPTSLVGPSCRDQNRAYFFGIIPSSSRLHSWGSVCWYGSCVLVVSSISRNIAS